MADLVSVVVPTRNSQRHIEACLRSIKSQTYADLELIVVDNQSEDTNTEDCEGSSDKVIVGGPERSAQRNAGAREGTGRYLLFIDSDMVIEPSVVAEARRAWSVAPVCVSRRLASAKGTWARCKVLERSCYVGDDTIEAARFFPPRAFRVRSAGSKRRCPRGPRTGTCTSGCGRSARGVGRTEAFIRHDEGAPRHSCS